MTQVMSKATLKAAFKKGALIAVLSLNAAALAPFAPMAQAQDTSSDIYLPNAQERALLRDAFSKLQGGDYAEARSMIAPLVEKSNRDALHMLGFMEERGLGADKNLSRAIELYAAAAAAGSADAQFALGELALLGEGVREDPERAVAWLRLAAQQGHVQAKIRLGMIYSQGRGVSTDQGEAVRYFKEAAERGDAGAQFNVGVAYLTGRGVAKNYDKAASWFERAAEQEHADAQYNLALLYDTDFLGAPDPVKMMKWMRAAADNGLPAAYVAIGLLQHGGRNEVAVTKGVSAADWFEKAARAGDAQGQFLYAVALANGDGRAPAPAEAVRWLNLALKDGLGLEAETRRNAERLRADLEKSLQP